ncbi:hypothetical protein [Microbacterium neimengense]
MGQLVEVEDASYSHAPIRLRGQDLVATAVAFFAALVCAALGTRSWPAGTESRTGERIRRGFVRLGAGSFELRTGSRAHLAASTTQVTSNV